MTASVPSHARRPTLWARLGSDDGATAIEFLIVAVSILAIMFTAIQASMYYWARSVAAAAAQEGADAQRAYNATPRVGQAKAYAFINSSGNTLTGAHVNVAPGAQQVQVTVTGRCLSVIPGFCRLFPITVTVHGTVERVTTP
jgi:Flp pilus assembly protein TadG